MCDRAVTTTPLTEAEVTQSDDSLLIAWTHAKKDEPELLMPGRRASDAGVRDGPAVPCIPHKPRSSPFRRRPDRLTYNRVVRTGLRCREVSSVNPVSPGNVQPRIEREFGMQRIDRNRQPTGARGRASASNTNTKNVEDSTEKYLKGGRRASRRKHRIDIVDQP